LYYDINNTTLPADPSFSVGQKINDKQFGILMLFSERDTETGILEVHLKSAPSRHFFMQSTK